MTGLHPHLAVDQVVRALFFFYFFSHIPLGMKREPKALILWPSMQLFRMQMY